MANGTTNPYDLQNIGFQQIMGAGQGGQDLQSLIQGLYGTLREGGYYGADAKGGLGDVGGGMYADPSAFGQDYSLESVINRMESTYGEDVKSYDQTTGLYSSPNFNQQEQGMQSLLELLKSVDIPGMQKEYGQDIGDVRAEIGSQMQGLQKGLTMGGKSGRYSGISAPRRNLGGGGRQQYMSDYYGLQEKQFEMERDMQKSMEEDLYSQVGQYMQLNPVV